MSLTQEQVKHIANLSRLQLSDEDVVKYQKELNSIVDYIDILEKVPEEDLKSISHNSNNILPLRKDEVMTGILSTREELLGCSEKKIINNSISINNIM